MNAFSANERFFGCAHARTGDKRVLKISLVSRACVEGSQLDQNWATLGPSWGHLGAILWPLGAILGPSLSAKGVPWASLGQLGAIMGPSWGHLGAILGRLGATLGPSWSTPLSGSYKEALTLTKKKLPYIHKSSDHIRSYHRIISKTSALSDQI